MGTDPTTAQQVQKLRASLQNGFQMFCQNPGQVPSAPQLAMFDECAAFLTQMGDKGAPAQGVKRTASWPAEGGSQKGKPAPKLAGKGGGAPWNQGGGKGFGGKGKAFGGKGKGLW